MADEFGGAGSDFSASTPQTNTISSSQPNVDSAEPSQSVSSAPANTNTSVNAENRSEGLQTRENGNQQIIAAAKNSEGTQGYVLVKGEDGKTHLKPSPLTEPHKNEGVPQEPNVVGTDANQPKLTDAPQQIVQQFNQQLPAYTLDEFSNAIATGYVDEKRVPQEYQRQYADWKINQAVQAHNAQQKAIAQQEAARRAEIEAQMNPETRQAQMREFLTGLDKEADARAQQDAGLSEEDVENLDLMDEDDPKLINYKLAKEWHRQDLMAKMQNRYADEQARRQRQEAVYSGINQFTEEQRAKEPNFDAIDRMLLTRVNDLTYKQAQVIVPVLQALQNGTINEAQTEILRNYYEDTRKMFYMQKNGLDTTPKAVNRPPTVERAGDGRDIKSVYVPDYSALAKSDVRGRRAWLAEFIRNRNQ